MFQTKTILHEKETNAGVSGQSTKVEWFPDRLKLNSETWKKADAFYKKISQDCYATEAQGLAHFGTRDIRPALRKKLPREFMSYSERMRLAVLSGMLDGDGSLVLSAAGSRKDGKERVVCNIGTSSPFLKSGLVHLLTSLGIRNSCSRTEPAPGRLQKWTSYMVSLSVIDLQKHVDNLTCRPSTGMAALKTKEFDRDIIDVVPARFDFLRLFTKPIVEGSLAMAWGNMQSAQSKAKRLGYVLMTRAWLDKAASALPDNTSEAVVWQKMLLSDHSVTWEVISTVEAKPTETVYDLIVPETTVFALANGWVVNDTVTIHTPSLHSAVDDVKEKLLPSKMLWSIKNRGTVVPTPKQESVLGIFQAQHRKAKSHHRFDTESEALSAIKSGHVKMSDEITIGDQK